MNNPAFKTAAYTMAENTPPHLGQPTLPPQGWVLEGANLVVLLADGRKVRGPIVDQKRDYWFPANAKPVTSLPIHPPKPSSPSKTPEAERKGQGKKK